MIRKLLLVITSVFAAAPTPALAQQPAAAAQAAAQAQSATVVVVQVVIDRYQGDKRLSSHPYTLSLVPGKNASLRIGAEIPVPSGSNADPKGPVSYSMQNLGTQIDCAARPAADGKYELMLTVTDRSIYPSTEVNQLGVRGIPNVPTFRSVTSASTLLLGNGQSAQFTSSTDKVTGEVFKVDVTLTVPK